MPAPAKAAFVDRARAAGGILANSPMIAYGGKDIITADGEPHLDGPKVKGAVIKAIAYIISDGRP